MKRSARIAAVTLLMLWVGPVSFVQNDTSRVLQLLGAPRNAAAYTDVIPAGKALVLKPGTRIKLRLVDGGTVAGAFLGRALLDSALYAARFAAHAGSPSEVFAMGETLRVSLRDGREMTAPFAGYGELTLLLRGPDGQKVRVPFEFAREIHRANGEPIELKALTKTFRSRSLPSAEVLALEEANPIGSEAERWANALRVPVEDIKAVVLDAESGEGGSTAGVVVLGVVASVVLVFVILNAIADSSTSGCGSGPDITLFSSRLTTRRFDLWRACYVGDALVAADGWPGDLTVPTAVNAASGAAPADAPSPRSSSGAH